MIFKIINRIKYEILLLTYKKRFKDATVSAYVHPKANIGKRVVISKNSPVGHPITIGAGTFINENVYLGYQLKNIGKYCSIASGVKIALGNHPTDRFSTSPVFYKKWRGLIKEDKYNNDSVKNTIIGNDVWIATNALIISGVKIGDGAVIAAGAVVVKDVKPYTIYGGVPAKLLGKRFEDHIIEKMNKLKWWTIEDEEFLSTLFEEDNIGMVIKKIEQKIVN